jgi:hypothetical protein
LSLRKKIEELSLSEQIKQSFQPSKSVWEHPLTLLVVGFVFTGLIGAIISWIIQSHETDRAEETRHYQSSTKTTTDLSNALYMRYVRASMLKSALARPGASPEEVRHRKELYDEALVQQESTVMSNFLFVREALKKQDYDEWEDRYGRDLKPLLNNLDNSLTAATDEYFLQIKSGKEHPAIDLSVADSDYKDVNNCEYAFVNGIFLTLSTKQYVTDAKKVIATQEEALQEVTDRCQSTRVPVSSPASPQ